jgi:hypothetical protein
MKHFQEFGQLFPAMRATRQVQFQVGRAPAGPLRFGRVRAIEVKIVGREATVSGSELLLPSVVSHRAISLDDSSDTALRTSSFSRVKAFSTPVLESLIPWHWEI